MIPSSELELNRVYKSAEGPWALIRRFVKEPANSDVVIPHNLGWVPKQAYVVSCEGKTMACWFKVVNGAAAKDTQKMTLQFSGTNAIVTLRIE